MERAVGVGLVLRPRHLAAIRIAKHNLHRLAGKRGILPLLGIGVAEDSLIEDDLPGPMDAAVGHDHDRVVGLRRRLLPSVRGLAADDLVAAVDVRLREEHDLAALLGRQFVAAVAVGHNRLPGSVPGRMPLLLHEHLHARVGERLARRDIDDMACERFPRPRIRSIRDKREPAHPDEPGRHNVVLLAEVWPVAGDHPIVAGRKLLRHRDVVRPLLIVAGRRQFGLEGLGRRSREQLRPLGIVEPAGMRSPREHSFEPVGLHDPQVHVREIAIPHTDHRPWLGPRPLDEHCQ